MDPGTITAMLADIRSGRPKAIDDLMGYAYTELRGMANARMRQERPDHTLQPTALVNEAYMRVFAGNNPALDDRRHFFGAFANAMRQVLVDGANARRAAKRGGKDAKREPMDVAESHRAADAPATDEDLLAMNAQLPALKETDPRAYEVLMLRAFGGLTDVQIGEVLGGVSSKTVQREWNFARAWIKQKMSGSNQE